MAGQVEHINPDGLNVNPAFTQVVTVTGPVKTVYIGAQTEQILKNIDVCLKAAGAGKEHLISWNIYVAQGQDMRPAFEAGMRWWGNKDKPPLNNVMFVSGFGPDFLILIDAIAVVPLP